MANASANSAIIWRTATGNIKTSIQYLFERGTEKFSVYSILEYTAADGKDYKTGFYNLDAILSVGYRVNSHNATQFRIWATGVLKEFLLRGYVVNQRIDRIERKLVEHEQKIDLIIKTELPPKEGIFYDGQIFDAYVFVSDLIKAATKTIVLIDNYVDENVLVLLTKRAPKVSAKIYTKQITRQFQLDLTRHNAQYETVDIEESNHFHDRFLLIDSTVYHIGASMKDLGKKLFAFSKMEIKAEDITKVF
jgi:hypothetical protein